MEPLGPGKRLVERLIGDPEDQRRRTRPRRMDSCSPTEAPLRAAASSSAPRVVDIVPTILYFPSACQIGGATWTDYARADVSLSRPGSRRIIRSHYSELRSLTLGWRRDADRPAAFHGPRARGVDDLPARFSVLRARSGRFRHRRNRRGHPFTSCGKSRRSPASRPSNGRADPERSSRPPRHPRTRRIARQEQASANRWHRRKSAWTIRSSVDAG